MWSTRSTRFCAAAHPNRRTATRSTPEVAAFEAEFAAAVGCAYGVGVASGTEAIQLGLLALGVEPGDEVITVSHTAVPTVSALTSARARPALVDVDPDTLTMDPARIED